MLFTFPLAIMSSETAPHTRVPLVSTAESPGVVASLPCWGVQFAPFIRILDLTSSGQEKFVSILQDPASRRTHDRTTQTIQYHTRIDNREYVPSTAGYCEPQSPMSFDREKDKTNTRSASTLIKAKTKGQMNTNKSHPIKSPTLCHTTRPVFAAPSKQPAVHTTPKLSRLEHQTTRRKRMSPKTANGAKQKRNIGIFPTQS